MIAFVLLLALLTAFPPLSIDMYLPAIPHLVETWQQPLAMVNLTLVLFFVSYCVSLLFYGPLSDRYGRKPPLVSGLVLFILASLICAASTGINMLIFGRIIQAVGAGAASSISLAMAKDRLEVSMRERVLSQISVIMALAPMISPMFGSLIMEYLSWPWIFVGQAGIGLLALAGVLKTTESHQGGEGKGLIVLLTRYFRVFANPRFMGVVFCNALIALPLFSFIAAAASIYIIRYSLSELTFALFFGGNAFFFMLGSMTCMRYGKKIGTIRMITWGYSGILLGGLWMLVQVLPDNPWRLALPMSLVTFSLGLSRPPSNNLALEQVKEDAGTASSTMVFTYFIFGALAMAVVSQDWSDKIVFIGRISALSGLTALTLWLLIKNSLHLPLERRGK